VRFRPISVGRCRLQSFTPFCDFENTRFRKRYAAIAVGIRSRHHGLDILVELGTAYYAILVSIQIRQNAVATALQGGLERSINFSGTHGFILVHIDAQEALLGNGSKFRETELAVLVHIK